MGIIREIRCAMFRHKMKNMTDVEIDKAVKIEGTQFDRKRKLDDTAVKEMIKMQKKEHLTYKELSVRYNMDIRTIRYAIDPDYRLRRISQSNGKHYGLTTYDSKNRVEYKKYLVNSGLIVK